MCENKLENKFDMNKTEIPYDMKKLRTENILK